MNKPLNCHSAIVTVQHPAYNRGQPFRTTLVPRFRGTEAQARAWLEAEKAKPHPIPTILAWHGLHSWHESEIPPQWGPPPLSGQPGPDEDETEVSDIPRAWEDWR